MPLKLRKSLPSKEKLYTAHVRLLDNTVIDINLAVTAKGKDCLDKIAQKLGLHEVRLYFVIRKVLLDVQEIALAIISEEYLDRFVRNVSKILETGE